MDVGAGQAGSYKYIQPLQEDVQEGFENMLPFIALLDTFLT